jgi:hypothetical protein
MAREKSSRESQQPPTGKRDDFGDIHGRRSGKSAEPDDSESFLAGDRETTEHAGMGLSEEDEDAAREHNEAQEARRAPAVLGKAPIPAQEQPVQESGDRQAMANLERSLGKRIATLDFATIPDPEVRIETHAGPWIVYPLQKDPDNKNKWIENRVPAKRIPIPPDEVLFYRGGVVRDHLSVHSATVVIGRERRIFIFDRFYVFEGKEYARCCWIPDIKWRAGVLFMKKIDRRSKKGVAILKKLANSTEPAYKIVKAREYDYRDLKRWFERIWIKGYQIDESLSQDESALLLPGETPDDLAQQIGVGALGFEYA